jgi:hypothetical protein
MIQSADPLYLKVKGRSWCCWMSPNDDLLMMPTDEKPFNGEELYQTRCYLKEEGFFKKYFKDHP